MRYYSEETVKEIMEGVKVDYVPTSQFDPSLCIEERKYPKLENYPSIEMPTPWHTGTPTEEGDYYIAFRNFLGADVEYGWATWDGKGWDINFMGWLLSNEILAWQKIEPYKED